MARPVGDDHRNRNTTIPRRKTVCDKRVCNDRQKTVSNGNRQGGKGQLILIYEQYFASRLSTDMSPMRNLSASRGRILSRTGNLPL